MTLPSNVYLINARRLSTSAKINPASKSFLISIAIQNLK
ncbi:hypothetical protein TASI_1028 [Taylorella asinigenitalis MCE3]|uniref:Uncharacterized protein n=1 Tax=Taylorella asinigenitalis (strain MCE3) TaxID=1008459 RepID=G4QBX1_TAYAM|nr:hypothetical protein TASI_1028 [Taylorella asinigenitalis MCE3]